MDYTLTIQERLLVVIAWLAAWVWLVMVTR